VEVPCVKRNALGTVQAMGASDLSLLEIESVVPMDEVVEAMMSISAKMSETIRETALGGLAVTKTGLALRKKMGLPPIPKKYLQVRSKKSGNGCNSCNGCG
jgi:L-serine dehydratase